MTSSCCFEAVHVECSAIDVDLDICGWKGGGGREKSIEAKLTADGCVVKPWNGGSSSISV